MSHLQGMRDNFNDAEDESVFSDGLYGDHSSDECVVEGTSEEGYILHDM
jgi:hypothetical protein